jgi:hypothetical protein
MSVKKIIFISVCAACTALFSAGCGTRRAADTGSEKPALEISFTGRTEPVSSVWLAAVIGTGSGTEETFGEQKSLVVFYNEDGCSTCEMIRPIVDEWVRESGCTVYSYSDDTAQGTAEEKNKMLEKLGGGNGDILTAGRLVAFVKGKRAGSVSGSYDIGSSEKIMKFISRLYDVPRRSEWKIKKLAELDGLTGLRHAVAEDGKFILYIERDSCPDCRMLSDPARSDVITKLCRSYTGKLYRIRTERTLEGLSEPVNVDGTEYESTFAYLDSSGASAGLWPDGKEPDKKKAELLEMLTSQSLVPPFPGDDAAYLKAVAAYAKRSGERFLRTDRFVPSFVVAGYPDGKSTHKSKAENALEKGYKLAAENDPIPAPVLLHRLAYPMYFGCDNTKIDTEQYYRVLTDWIVSWE